MSEGPAIVVSDLTYVYPAGPVALQGVALEVAAGESVGLVGPNGAGKTSLFLCLAGVLAMRPAVLLLDEPSMFLDPRGRRELIALLNALGGTKVIASHDLELVLRTCGRVVVLDAGRVMADGPARTVLADEALMERHGLEVPASLQRP